MRALDTAPFDHGMLNIPLAKRQGDIDAQIDCYKDQQAAQARRKASADRAAHIAAMGEARTLIASLSAERLADLGRPHNLTPTKTRDMLLSIARSNPQRAIRVLARESAQ